MHNGTSSVRRWLRQARSRFPSEWRNGQRRDSELLADLQQQLGQLRAELRIAQRDGRAAQTELERAVEALARPASLDFFFGRGITFFDRALDEDDASELSRQIEPIVGFPVLNDLLQAHRGLLWAESLSLGRVAGTTANILGKLVTTRALAPRGANVLEIGTLYGVFAGCLHHELSRSGDPPRLTLVDPLQGTQLQPGKTPSADPTRTPVTEWVVRRNLTIANVPPEQVRILQGSSGDAVVREAVGSERYDVIIVDGDHSEAGVQSDLAWAIDIIAPGGIIVVDDYGDPRWPGVSSAADQFVEVFADRVSVVGIVATSAFIVVD